MQLNQISTILEAFRRFQKMATITSLLFHTSTVVLINFGRHSNYLLYVIFFVNFQAQLVTAPAGFPQPVINNENVAPTLNTVPAQTRAHEEHLQIAMQQQLQQMEAQQQIQIMQQQQEIAAARHFGRL